MSLTRTATGKLDTNALDSRMRDRWDDMAELWDANKGKTDTKSLLENLDWMGKMSKQLAWLQDPGDRPTRIAYTGYGEPTASLIHDRMAIVDYKLFWVACRNATEAYYLLAIINSNALAVAAKPYCTTNWAKKIRDLQKHLWKLPIPEFDRDNAVHATLSGLGRGAEPKPRLPSSSGNCVSNARAASLQPSLDALCVTNGNPPAQQRRPLKKPSAPCWPRCAGGLGRNPSQCRRIDPNSGDRADPIPSNLRFQDGFRGSVPCGSPGIGPNQPGSSLRYWFGSGPTLLADPWPVRTRLPYVYIAMFLYHNIANRQTGQGDRVPQPEGRHGQDHAGQSDPYQVRCGGCRWFPASRAFSYPDHYAHIHVPVHLADCRPSSSERTPLYPNRRPCIRMGLPVSNRPPTFNPLCVLAAGTFGPRRGPLSRPSPGSTSRC